MRDAAVRRPLATASRRLASQSLERAADRKRCVPALAWLEVTGLPVDAERWVARAQHEAAPRAAPGSATQELVGRDEGQFLFLAAPRVNWQSPAQVRALLQARGHQF